MAKPPLSTVVSKIMQDIEGGPHSFDSLFIDDDDMMENSPNGAHCSADSDDDSFTIIDDCVPPRPFQLNEGDDRRHLQKKTEARNPKATDKMRNKIIGFWHNVKYGRDWTVSPKSSFNKNKPIFLLSKCYDCRMAYEDGDDAAVKAILIQFKQDFTSRIWITYRQGFPCITDTHITSDSGWGCMIRSGQMLLAQGLVTHFLTREWNMFTHDSVQTTLRHREIIKWFGDQPSSNSPFSLHRLVNIGKSIDRKAGDWFGPVHVATLLEKACPLAADFNPLLKQVCVYVAPDCAIYTQDVIKLATGGADSSSSNGDRSENWKSVIVIVPVRLGTERLNPIYIPCLKGLFLYENFLGIMGGVPSRSMYFVGFQDSKLIHLDPHLMQDTVDVSKREFPWQSYHCVYPKKISFTSIDPCCALGFYCRTRTDFETFLKAVQPYLLPPSDSEPSYPLFSVIDGCREDVFNNHGR